MKASFRHILINIISLDFLWGSISEMAGSKEKKSSVTQSPGDNETVGDPLLGQVQWLEGRR